MTDQREKVSVQTDDGAVAPSPNPSSPLISRRSLMRGASVAVPTILTLNSNAAFGWAITSGTIGTRAANLGAEGDAFCVVGDETKPGVYDAQSADVYEISGSYQYKSGADGAGDTINSEVVCETSGEISYTSDGETFANVTAPGGAVVSVSATQATSFASVSTILFPEI